MCISIYSMRFQRFYELHISLFAAIYKYSTVHYVMHKIVYTTIIKQYHSQSTRFFLVLFIFISHLNTLLQQNSTICTSTKMVIFFGFSFFIFSVRKKNHILSRELHRGNNRLLSFQFRFSSLVALNIPECEILDGKEKMSVKSIV